MPSLRASSQSAGPGLTFHRTFALSRPSLAQILALVKDGLPVTKEMLSSRTSLGTIYQEAMPRYAYRVGLLDGHQQLTQFGHSVAQSDLHQDALGTQWLLHYHLSAPHGPGPAFWHELVVTHFRSGNRFTAEQVNQQLAAFVRTTSGRQLAARSLCATTTVFLRTYIRSDGLGKLGIIEKTGRDHYRVSSPPTPPHWALAYALMDYWQAHYGGRLTVNLADLLTERGFAALFLMGEAQLLSVLTTLQEEGVVELYRVAPPFQVVLIQPDPELALRRLYAQ